MSCGSAIDTMGGALHLHSVGEEINWLFLGIGEAKLREYVREAKDDTIRDGEELAALKAHWLESCHRRTESAVCPSQSTHMCLRDEWLMPFDTFSV